MRWWTGGINTSTKQWQIRGGRRVGAIPFSSALTAVKDGRGSPLLPLQTCWSWRPRRGGDRDVASDPDEPDDGGWSWFVVSAHRGRGSRQTRSTAVEGTPPQRAHPDAGGLGHRRSRRAAPAHIPPSRDVFFDSSRGDEGKERGLLGLHYLHFPPLAWPGVPGDQNSSLGRCDRYCAKSFHVQAGHPTWCGLSVVAVMAARVRPAWGTGRPGVREARRLPMRRPDEVNR